MSDTPDSACTPKNSSLNITTSDGSTVFETLKSDGATSTFREVTLEQAAQTMQTMSEIVMEELCKSSPERINKGLRALTLIMRLGKQAAIDITGMPECANDVRTPEQAYIAVSNAMRLGTDANNKLNHWRLHGKESE